MIGDGDMHIVVVAPDGTSPSGSSETIICFYDEEDHTDCRGRKHSEWTDLIKETAENHPPDNIRLRLGPCPTCVLRKPRY